MHMVYPNMEDEKAVQLSAVCLPHGAGQLITCHSTLNSGASYIGGSVHSSDR